LLSALWAFGDPLRTAAQQPADAMLLPLSGPTPTAPATTSGQPGGPGDSSSPAGPGQAGGTAADPLWGAAMEFNPTGDPRAPAAPGAPLPPGSPTAPASPPGGSVPGTDVPPTIVAITAISPDTGVSSNDFLTNASAPRVLGYGTAGASFFLAVDGQIALA